MSNTPKIKAFTLTEIMFVTLIAGFVSGVLAMFLMNSSKAIYATAQKGEIANNIRQLIGEMESTGRSSNVCYVYKSFNLGDRSSALNRLSAGQSGDFLMFISTQPDANPLNQDNITRIVGYFRKPDATGNGPVYKFTLSYNPAISMSTNSPEGLISSLPYSSAYPKVAQCAQGLSNGSLFYYYQTSTVMVKANLLQGSPKPITNAINLTIAPRG